MTEQGLREVSNQLSAIFAVAMRSLPGSVCDGRRGKVRDRCWWRFRRWSITDDGVNPRRVAVGSGTKPSGNPAGGAAPTRRSANVGSDVFVNGRRRESHRNQRGFGFADDPSLRAGRCRRIWWCLAKWAGRFVRRLRAGKRIEAHAPAVVGDCACQRTPVPPEGMQVFGAAPQMR